MERTSDCARARRCAVRAVGCDERSGLAVSLLSSVGNSRGEACEAVDHCCECLLLSPKRVPNGEVVCGVRDGGGEERRERRWRGRRAGNPCDGLLANTVGCSLGPLLAPIRASNVPKPFGLCGMSVAAKRDGCGVGHVQDCASARKGRNFACAVLDGVPAESWKGVARSAAVRAARLRQPCLRRGHPSDGRRASSACPGGSMLALTACHKTPMASAMWSWRRSGEGRIQRGGMGWDGAVGGEHARLGVVGARSIRDGRRQRPPSSAEASAPRSEPSSSSVLVAVGGGDGRLFRLLTSCVGLMADWIRVY